MSDLNEKPLVVNLNMDKTTTDYIAKHDYVKVGDKEFISRDRAKMLVAKLANSATTCEKHNILTSGVYLGSLIGKKVKVKPGLEFECRGYYLNDNGSGTLYGKKGHISFQTIDDISPCL